MEIIKNTDKKKNGFLLKIDSIFVDIWSFIFRFKKAVFNCFKKFFKFLTNKENTVFVAIKKFIFMIFGFGLIINYEFTL